MNIFSSDSIMFLILSDENVFVYFSKFYLLHCSYGMELQYAIEPHVILGENTVFST